MKDYHLHSGLLDHTENDLKNILKVASTLGFKEVAITEHLTWILIKNPAKIGEGNYDTLYLEEKQIPQDGRKTTTVNHYLDLIDKSRQGLRLKVLKGLEVDYFKDYESEIRDSLSKYKLDIILGSCHYSPLYDNPKNYFNISELNSAQIFIDKYGEDSLYSLYFGNVMSAVRSKIFDYMAHIDLLKNSFNNYNYDKAKIYLEPLLKEMIKNDVGLEINLSGLKKVGETYPSMCIIKKYIALGGKKISIGSDSHSISRMKKMAPIMRDFSKIYAKFLDHNK
ncbi:MAG: PHP domain-containing protein [Patescibacteria group bacterium]|jgi:histidinol-phosphatase (PHP family)|nr:PHP domain-containing protein [Patescibacteria group bacterium]